jgi:hypothetical protein
MITMIAITSKMWINPPIVYDDTTPKSHKIRRMTAIVINMIVCLVDKTTL